MSYFLILSHFFLLPLFIELNFTVSFNFQAHRVSWLISYCFLLHLFFFESVFTSWCSPISYFLLAYFLLSFFFLLHLFIELILLPHLIVQVTHCLACFLLLIVFYYVSRLTVSRCVTLVSHLCHICVTLLSPSVTLYKREGVWTDD